MICLLITDSKVKVDINNNNRLSVFVLLIDGSDKKKMLFKGIQAVKIDFFLY
jgi:hypothetical protein